MKDRIHKSNELDRRGGVPRVNVAKLLSSVLCAGLLLSAQAAIAQSIVVGSKKDTEGVILGEIATQWLSNNGIAATHRAELGGTQFLWQALLTGEIDIYPDYTGTLIEEILAGQNVSLEELQSVLESLDV